MLSYSEVLLKNKGELLSLKCLLSELASAILLQRQLTFDMQIEGVLCGVLSSSTYRGHQLGNPYNTTQGVSVLNQPFQGIHSHGFPQIDSKKSQR